MYSEKIGNQPKNYKHPKLVNKVAKHIKKFLFKKSKEKTVMGKKNGMRRFELGLELGGILQIFQVSILGLTFPKRGRQLPDIFTFLFES